jgi:hypothetical protein
MSPVLILKIDVDYCMDKLDSFFIGLYRPFVGPWPVFQFPNQIHSRWDSLDGVSARSKAPTYTKDNTNIELGFDPIISVLKRAKAVHATVIVCIYKQKCINWASFLLVRESIHYKQSILQSTSTVQSS